MMLLLYVAMLCVAVDHVAAAVYGEHEMKDEMKNYLLYDVKVKHGKGNLHQAFDVLSDLHLGNAYKIVGEPRALFEVADKHACPNHVVDIPGAHVDVLLARPLISLTDDFNVTLNNTNDMKYPDNKYLTLIEATYQDKDVMGGTAEVLKNIVDGFAEVHDSDDCDNCIRGHFIVGSRPPMVIYLANVKPADVLELYEKLGLNAGSATAQARRLINFHSYVDGKVTNCFSKGAKPVHATANTGIVYDIKPIQGYGNTVNDISIHGGKQGSVYETKKSIPSYENNRHNDVKLPNYNINLGTGYEANKPTHYGAEKSTGYVADKPTGYGGDKSTGYGADKSTGNGADKSNGYAADKSTGYETDKPTGYGADKTTGYDDGKTNDKKIHPTDDKQMKTSGGYGSNTDGSYGQKPQTGYQDQQNTFYTGYNPPKQGGFNFNLGSKDATQHLFVF